MNVTPRLNRMFAADGRCLVVALDHGMFHEASFLQGIEDAPAAVRKLAESAPDAIQLTPGQAHLLQAIPGPSKPTFVMRADTTNIYTRPREQDLFDELLEGAALRAVQLDAAAIVVNLIAAPGNSALHATCLRNLAKLRAEASIYGLPLMVEPLVLRLSADGSRWESSDDPKAIATLCRQAVEMGADLLKSDPCADAADFPRIVEAASGKPVLVRGGATVGLEALLERTHAQIAAGAQGLVFGRNILQAAHPEGLVNALMAMLHQGAMPADALRLVSPED